MAYMDEQKYSGTAQEMREGSVVSELERLAKSAAVVEHGIDEMMRAIQPVLRPDEAVPTDGLTAMRQPVACDISGRIRDATELFERLGKRLHDLSQRVGIT